MTDSDEDTTVALHMIRWGDTDTLVLQLWPEHVGAEEALDSALSGAEIEFRKEQVQLAGPEVVNYVLDSGGEILGGVAAVIAAWTNRHRQHRVTIHLPNGASIDVRGRPLTPEEIQQLVDSIDDVTGKNDTGQPPE